MLLRRLSLRVAPSRCLFRGLSSTGPNADFLQGRHGTNYDKLSPISFLYNSSYNTPNVAAYVHGDLSPESAPESIIKRTWKEVYNRVCSTTSFLRDTCKLNRGDIVSIIAVNSPSIFEAHFSVPAANGAVLHSINTRLDVATVTYQIEHARSKVLMIDCEHFEIMNEVLENLDSELLAQMTIIDIYDPIYYDNQDEYNAAKIAWKDRLSALKGKIKGHYEYDDLTSTPLSRAEKEVLCLPQDEYDAISLNYTSGTTGNPKGVVLHHRGAYLNTLSNVISYEIRQQCQHLWIVPMFHCNGWCLAWAMAASSGTSYFLRNIRPAPILYMLHKYRVALFAGAPITMLTMLNHVKQNSTDDSNSHDPSLQAFKHDIKFITAGSPPPPPLIRDIKRVLNIDVQTAYGLTETYGPATAYLGEAEDISLNADQILDKATYQAMNIGLSNLTVIDIDTGLEVPVDGVTKGEVVIAGNTVMKGYLNNPEATNKDFKQNVGFLTGDIGVRHPNGRIQIKDRSKDVIISGGENISSVEVETILLTHPDIEEVAVVAKPDRKWGEVPCAFVTLKSNKDGETGSNAGSTLNETELIKWARQRMAGFQTPKAIVFVEDLPKTITGKVTKNVLKAQLAEEATE